MITYPSKLVMLMARYNAMVSSLPIVHILILAQHIALIILPTSVALLRNALRHCDIVIDTSVIKMAEAHV